MSFWKRLGIWLGFVAKPKDEPEVEETPTVPKEQRIIAEMDTILTWLPAFITKTLAESKKGARTEWHKRDAGLFIDEVRVEMWRQVEGYYAVSLQWSVTYSRRLNDFMFSSRTWEETWTKFDHELAENYLFNRLPFPISRNRAVKTPLFGISPERENDCDDPNFVFYIGELPAAETINGQYTPENHEQLVDNQRTQRDVYRAFADIHLKEQALWDARAFVLSLHERLVDSNATHLNPNDSFKGVFHDAGGSGNLGGYELSANGVLIFDCYNRYNSDRRLEEILAWCWTLQDYQRHYQDLFQGALTETLAMHNSTTQYWHIERDGLLWAEHPEARFCKMRFRLLTMG